MGHPQEAGVARVGIGRMSGLDREADRRGYCRIDGALELGEHGAERRMAVLFASGTLGITAQAHVGIVLVGTAVERANDGELVHHPGQTRHVLADLDAGDVGGDGAEGAADLRRGLHLEVVHILVRGAAGQVDHDDGFVRSRARARRSAAAWALRTWGNASPPMARPPIFRKCRREWPSQYAAGFWPRMESIAWFSRGWPGALGDSLAAWLGAGRRTFERGSARASGAARDPVMDLRIPIVRHGRRSDGAG